MNLTVQGIPVMKTKKFRTFNIQWEIVLYIALPSNFLTMLKTIL